ncbi:MAG: right-handed parallel beta-helix repeat-containing protein, partial [Thermoplasmata archaeon]
TMVFGLIVIIDVTVDISLNVGGTTLYVNTTGSGGAYTKIQDAINASNNGDTIFVYNGTYNGNLVVNKTINLNGENNNNTIINGSGFGDVVTVIADWVNITGFAITNSGDRGYPVDAGIELYNVTNCMVLNNNFLGNCFDVYLYNCSKINVSFNALLDNQIYLYNSHRNEIIGNYGIGNFFYGRIRESNYNKLMNNNVFSTHIEYSSNNIISNNTMAIWGITIWGNLIEHWNTHIIDASNTINGKPIYYLKNQTTGSVPSGGAQIILANCTAMNVKNHDINYGYSGIRLGFSSNNTIQDNNVSSALFGFSIDHSDGNNISSNNASNMKRGITLYHSNRNNLSYNILTNNSFEGLSINSGLKNIIFNNTICANNYSGILLLGSNNTISFNNISKNGDGIRIGSCYNNTVINNTISNNGKDIDTGIGIYLKSSSGNNICNNSISYNGNLIIATGIGIKIRTSYNNIIYNNSIHSNFRYGITLESSSNNKIFNNSIWDQIAIGIELYSSSNNTISKNYIWYNSYGISLENSENNTLLKNEIWDHSEAIHFETSYYNTISSNLIWQNSYGLLMDSSSNNPIINNDILYNGYGILIWSSSSENTVSNNSINWNEYNGIELSMNSNANTITYNTISHNNDYGIYITGSVQNRIYHNNLDTNTNQALDDTNNGNQWDNGYPLGGNYWSDYNGIDLNSTPTQDVPPPDGIGDTPYIIDPDSRDNYPLIAPIENYIFLKYGWNFISIPLIQVDQRINKVLDIIDDYYDAVQWYDNTDPNDPWKHYKVNKPIGNYLSEINETMGFWIHITQPGDTIFLYNGTQPTLNQTIALHPGWNMVGYPSITSHNRTEGLNNLTFGQEIDLIQWYDAGTKTWHDMDENDYFVPGRGYWIHAKAECEWEVPL